MEPSGPNSDPIAVAAAAAGAAAPPPQFVRRRQESGGSGGQSGRRLPTLSIPAHDPVHFDADGDDDDEGGVTGAASGATTAPALLSDRVRFFSFGHAAPRRVPPGQRAAAAAAAEAIAAAGEGSPLGVAASFHAPRPELRRVRYLRQNTVAGEGAKREFPHLLSRAISRTYTLTSNASSSIPPEEWRPIFDKLDLESDGRADGSIPLAKFRQILEADPVWSEAVPTDVQEQILARVDRNGDGVIDFDEFLDMVRGRSIGLSSRRKRAAFRELIKDTVEFIVPYKYSYQNQYSCSPPPLFMLAVSLLQAIIFVYDSIALHKEIGYVGLNGPVPYCSSLIYNPDRRKEIWRFVTYMLTHSGLFHVTFNILIQLVLGIPLEMVHGWWRVALVYLSGVVAGSLWTSVLRPTVFLSGASGGVYALITAHLGTVVMNFREMTCPWCRVLVVLLVALADTLVFIYDAYLAGAASGGEPAPVSYPAHISGAATGLLVGISALKNLRWEPHERFIWALSTVTFCVLILVAVVWNLAAPSHFKGSRVPIVCDGARVL